MTSTKYVIVMLDKSTIGNKIKLSIKARQKELDDLNNSRIYQEYNESFTGVEFFNTVFKGTSYQMYRILRLTHQSSRD